MTTDSFTLREFTKPEPQTTVTWRDMPKTERTMVATRALLNEPIYDALPIRIGHAYPKQVNTHGRYYFSQTRQHLWAESRLEMYVLAWIDMHADIRAIATQPMRIDFADGTTHFPDFLALHKDGAQVVYDVKPKSRITPKVAEQFMRTREFCREVGYGYKVCTELPPQVQANVQYLWNYRAMVYDPGVRTRQRITEALAEPAPLGRVALATGLLLPEARVAIFHLLWKRELHTNLNRRLSDTSLLERTDHANA